MQPNRRYLGTAVGALLSLLAGGCGDEPSGPGQARTCSDCSEPTGQLWVKVTYDLGGARVGEDMWMLVSRCGSCAEGQPSICCLEEYSTATFVITSCADWSTMWPALECPPEADTPGECVVARWRAWEWDGSDWHRRDEAGSFALCRTE